jgi:hypothetical protein
MKRPRVRIGTLMLLVVIVALAVALVIERRRSAKEIAALKAARFSPNVRFDSRFAPAQ